MLDAVFHNTANTVLDILVIDSNGDIYVEIELIELTKTVHNGSAQPISDILHIENQTVCILRHISYQFNT